ncbi:MULTISPECIES: MFS transporter [unclassified Streptomyces]|uniref:MFS transporter n=1 Tax=unclassified Streptomyces TaxID=2593676 RepID=UPI00224D2CA0|nr:MULTISPECIES: MFS transporter [unclassified Streptomyces]MCX5328641.1 MFS transporter [Streptomyces sp. NBC_00140]MCX5358052.1 MFS transporter [Streptomyces sp. NBC_00124]
MRRRAVLALLTACVFVMGTAEWVMVGLLPELSTDLHRPLPTVGVLATVYALVVAVAGPVVTLGMLGITRHRTLLILLGVFVAGNAAAALATGSGVLAAARMLTALTHSTVFATALVIAVTTVPGGRRGRAIAVITAGWNLAMVLGAPLGTWIGDHYGWRTTFAGIAILGAAILTATSVLVRPAAPETAGRPGGEVREMLKPKVAAVLALIVVAQAVLLTTYTYIAPLLRQVSGFTAAGVTTLLALFGLGSIAGNILGGRLADRAPWAALCALLAVLATVLAAFTLTSQSRWAAAATVLILGVIAGALIPLLQDRALASALKAPTLVTAVSASAFNLGVAADSTLGGRAVTAGSSLDDLPWISALVTLAAVGLAATAAQRRRAQPRTPMTCSIP